MLFFSGLMNPGYKIYRCTRGIYQIDSVKKRFKIFPFNILNTHLQLSTHRRIFEAC